MLDARSWMLDSRSYFAVIQHQASSIQHLFLLRLWLVQSQVRLQRAGVDFCLGLLITIIGG